MKSLSLLLILLLASASLIIINSVAASIPKPSVPIFTVRYVDHSFDVPPTYSVNQFTGKTEMTKEGYHVQNKSVVVTITNLPFSPLEGTNLGLYYEVQWKGYFGEYWSGFNESSSNSVYVVSEGYRYLLYPDAPFTVLNYGFSGNNSSSRYMYSAFISDTPQGGWLDIRVRALIGYYTRINDTDKYVPGIPVFDPTDPIPHHYVFTGESSGWSDIQAITMPGDSDSTSSPEPTASLNPTQSPTETPSTSDTITISKFELVVVVVAVVLTVTAVAAALLMLQRRRRRD